MNAKAPPPPRWLTEKMLGRTELVARFGKAVRKKSVALTNGCFDLLHVGHVRYLKAAKTEADILLVAINSDASTRRLKGPGRPIQPEGDRAEIVASLECVDYVTIFDEPTVGPLIEALEPDVQCKGTDYTEEDVPERETVLNHGGRVAIVGDPKDHATSSLIERLSRS